MAKKVTYAGLDKAISIAAAAFEGKFDKGGVPYIMHCLHVMNGVKHLGTEAMIAAVLHDLIEDTDWTAENLIAAGFNPHTISIIVLLTHLKGESYDEYIMRVAVSRRARAIKMADLRHNSDIHRMKGLSDKDFKRIEKYHRAYAFLNELAE
jgi:(p)ppGpp synthase/HD superfamily hydrolase